MVVLILTDVLEGWGGAENNIYYLTKGLENRGHKVIICCLKYGFLSEWMRHEKFRIQKLEISKLYSLKGIKTIFRIVRLIKEEKVSVILSYHIDSDYLGALASVLKRTPIISNRRDLGINLRLRHICLYRLVNPLFDDIVAVSKSVKKFLVKSQKINPAKISVINNGVDIISWNSKPALFGHTDKQSGLEDISVKVGCVANFRPVKGHTVLIEAASILVKQFPEVYFYLVGNQHMDKAYFRSIKNKVKELGLGNVVKFIGEMSFLQVHAFWRSIDIAVSPSYSEGMPNVLLEAMAAGKPVVATSVGGSIEVVKDNETGFLVPSGNPQLLSNALFRLSTRPELRFKMGLKGSQVIESEFSMAKMIDRYEALLKYAFLKKKI